MNAVGRAALAVALGMLGVVGFMMTLSLLLSVAPESVDDALNEVGLGSDEFGAIALFLLAGVSGGLVGLIAGWYMPDAKRLGWTYAGLLAGAFGLSIVLLTGVYFIGGVTDADGTDLRGWLGFACLPVALVGFFFLLRRTHRRAGE